MCKWGNDISVMDFLTFTKQIYENAIILNEYGNNTIGIRLRRSYTY